ncbi:methanol dehydrogenase regulatory protein [Candidatus Magnetoovum chiemensis]|nr:methanol dehydrogenase regulatory protein [Candidatus Magnetoovum chiemensis]
MEVKNHIIKKIIAFLSNYLQGKENAITLSLITIFSRGHVLIEDLPGLGKTTLAIGIAHSLGLTFGRIQCTSDLLPTDITGLTIYSKNKEEFEFRKGPIFNNTVLVDEINRATPKTQSALLEAMAEKQVTIEENTYKLNQPFFVIATQNPIEQFGTFPLPESQLDRFMMKTSIGYPSKASEREILKGGSKREELYKIEPIINEKEVLRIQKIIKNDIYMSDKVLDYILSIIDSTRRSKYLTAGISTRGALALTTTAKASAFFQDRDFVIPEDVKGLTQYTIPHRVIFKEEHRFINAKEIIKSLVQEIPVPL